MNNLEEKIEEINKKIQKVEKEQIILETNMKNDENKVKELEKELNDIIIEKFGSLDILKSKKIEEIIEDLSKEVENNNDEILSIEKELLILEKELDDLE